MPIIPDTREAEAGKSLEPRRWRLQYAEITPLHSSLSDKSETLGQVQWLTPAIPAIQEVEAGELFEGRSL